jgi:CRISPR system Cascade subunit CasD
MCRTDDTTLAELASLQFGVRVDRAGSLLHDYHTAGGGTFRGGRYYVYGASDCVPSHRYYLQGASFVAALAGNDALVLRIAAALQVPRYALFLGRRSCAPSVPVFTAVVDGDVRTALGSAPLAENADEGPYRMVLESGDGNGDVRYDVPLSFAQIERRYGQRQVITEWVTAAAPIEVAS